MKRITFIITTLITCLSASLSAQKLSLKYVEQLDSILNTYYQEKAPGAALTVLYKGETVYMRTIGYANVEHEIAISPQSLFNIASNSKQFTTLTALLLEKEGKLSFDDPITKYLPELKKLPYTISIKQLANHTHGLPNVDELANLLGKERMTHEEVISMLLNIRSANFKPGSKYQYNNTGYALLSHIVERVSEKPFPEVLAEKIFQPLNMNQSKAIGDFNQLIKNKAYSYTAGNEDANLFPVRISTMGSSGIYSNVEDFVKWSANFLDEEGLFQQELEQMKIPTLLNDGKNVAYGMGLQMGKHKGIDIVFHGGGTEGYRSYMLHAPEYELSIVFLSNAGGLSGYGVIYATLEKLLSDHIQVAHEQAYTAPLNKFTGVYEFSPGSYYSIWAKNDSLYFGDVGETNGGILPRIGNRKFDFFGAYSSLEFTDEGFLFNIVDFSYPAQKVSAPKNNSNPDLQQYTGNYVNKEHQIKYEIIEREGELIITGAYIGELKMSSYASGVFYIKNSPFGKISFTKNKDNSWAGFKLASQNIDNLDFDKVECEKHIKY